MPYDKDTFVQWHSLFAPKLSKLSEEFFDKVQESHESIRKEIGGTETIKTIKVDGEQKSANSSVFDELSKELFDMFPLLQNVLELNDFSIKDIRKPTLPQGTHNINKTSKFLRSVWDQQYGMYCESSYSKFNTIISKMGVEWAKFKCLEETLTMQLSTAAESFCNLGHYTVDFDSCFRNAKENDFQKYFLGLAKNSFVLLINDDKGINIGRFWGFTTENHKRYNICNFYIAKKAHEGTILEGVKLFFADLLKCTYDELQTKQNNNKIRPGLYHNAYGSYSFFKESEEKFAVLDVYVDSDYTNDGYYVVCQHCGNNYDHADGWELIDVSFVCSTCYDSAALCYESKEKTLGHTEIVGLANGENVCVKRKFAINYPTCQHCYNRYEKSVMIEDEVIKGKFWHKHHERKEPTIELKPWKDPLWVEHRLKLEYEELIND